MTGKMSRNKGKRGEREAASEVSRLFCVDAKRGVQFKGGQDSPDIETGINGVHFEVKRVEQLQLYKSLEQAEDDGGTNIPVVLHRRNNKTWVAITYLDDLPHLVKILSSLKD